MQFRFLQLIVLFILESFEVLAALIIGLFVSAYLLAKKAYELLFSTQPE